MKSHLWSVNLVLILLLLVVGCGKDEKSDKEEITEAVTEEYWAYFDFSEAMSADNEALFRLFAPTVVYDSICDWRYPPAGRTYTRSVSVSVSGDVATVTVSRTMTGQAIYRVWLAETLRVYNRSVSFSGTRYARFVRAADGTWDLDAISPLQLKTADGIDLLDSLVAINHTDATRFVITDPAHLIPLDSIFSVSPEDTVDVYAYAGDDVAIIFRHPRSGHYERTHMRRESGHTHRYGLRTGMHRGVRHFVVDAITLESALNSELPHTGEIWAMCFIVE